MNELFTWMTTWDKYVKTDNRERDEEPAETKPRKRVVLKKTKR